MLPILLPVNSVNHKFPSGPAVIKYGSLPPVNPFAYSVIVPETAILPIRLPLHSVNHKLPSGPATIPFGSLKLVGTVYSVTEPSVVILLIRFRAEIGRASCRER